MVTELHPFITFSHDVQNFITRSFWVAIHLLYNMQCYKIKACFIPGGMIRAPTSALNDDNLGDFFLHKMVNSLPYNVLHNQFNGQMHVTPVVQLFWFSMSKLEVDVNRGEY